MPATLLPNAETQFIDGNGKPIAGGKVYFYIPNTTTYKSTWQDPAKSILNQNPVILDGAGRAIIWGNGTYRQVVYDQFGNLVWDQLTQDSSAGLIGDMTDDLYYAANGDFVPGTTTSLTLTSDPGTVANSWVYFDGVYQADNQIASIAFPTITFTSPIPVGTTVVTIKIGNTIAIGTPASASVTDASVAANAAIKSTKLSYLEGDVGSVVQTVQARLRVRISVKDFGAVGDGATDDTAAFTAAFNAIAAAGGGSLYIPAGTYYLTSAIGYTMPTANEGFSIIGDGSSVTILKFHAAVHGLQIGLNGPFTGVQIEGISLTTNTVNLYNAITITQTVAVPDPANVVESMLTDVVMYGEGGFGSGHLNCWQNGVYVSGASNINFDTVNCFGGASSSYPNTGGAAFNISGTPANIPCVFNFVNCSVTLMGSGIIYGAYVQGMAVANCNFTGCYHGIWAPSTAPDLVQLCVTNSQFNCQANIQCDSAIQGLVIANNFFLCGNSMTNIQLTNTSLSLIYGNTFEPAIFPVTNANGIVVQNTAASGISANIFGNTFVNISSTCIFLDTTAKYCNVGGNTFYGTSLNTVLNNGNFNKIQPNQVGLVPTPSQVPPTPAFPPTSVAYTNNTGFSCRVFITGGTFTSVTLAGVAMAASGNNWSGEVQAGETISIAYTAVPAWTWVGK